MVEPFKNNIQIGSFCQERGKELKHVENQHLCCNSECFLNFLMTFWWLLKNLTPQWCCFRHFKSSVQNHLWSLGSGENDAKTTHAGKRYRNSHLVLPTTIFYWMFGETTISYVKNWNHPIETTTNKWMFGVPGRQGLTIHNDVKIFRTANRAFHYAALVNMDSHIGLY